MFSASISIQAEGSTSHNDLTEGGSVVTGAKDKAMIGVNRVLHLHEGFFVIGAMHCFWLQGKTALQSWPGGTMSL